MEGLWLNELRGCVSRYVMNELRGGVPMLGAVEAAEFV